MFTSPNATTQTRPPVSRSTAQTVPLSGPGGVSGAAATRFMLVK